MKNILKFFVAGALLIVNYIVLDWIVGIQITDPWDKITKWAKK